MPRRKAVFNQNKHQITYEEIIKNPTIKLRACYSLLSAYDLKEACRKNAEKDMRKKAQSDIRYAVNMGYLSLEWGGRSLNTMDFLRWAANKYPRFGEALKVPRETVAAGFDASSISGGVKVRRIDYIPDDKLREAYKEKCHEVFALEDRIEELKALNAEDKRDAEMWRRCKSGWAKESED